MERKTKEFSLTKTLDAPIEKVWDAWTKVEQLNKWFGPKGFPVTESRMNFKVGGQYHYGMKMPHGEIMWGRWIFLKIEKPNLIEWEHHFSDAEGKAITRHPFSTTWPLEMRTTIEFEDLKGKTNLTIKLIAYNTTDVERETFEGGFAGMNQGWGGTLDQLCEFLGEPK